jgi:peptidoglycan/LPS O-acetylase OafA/YrhL
MACFAWKRPRILAAVEITAARPPGEGDQPAAPPPQPAARRQGEFHIPSLDGIRAVSFLVVFVAHAGLGHIIPGGFGVTVFFFLSGYLITTLLRLEHEGTGRISLRDFYLRRVLRILPPFYLVLVLALVLTASGLLQGELRTWPVLAQLGHLTNYWAIRHGADGTPAGTAVYWSLAVEEHFYLLFPCLFILLQRRLPGRWRVQGRILLGLCLLVLAWRLALIFPLHAAIDRTYLGSDTRIDSILFGCALAVGANPVLDPPRSPALWRYLLLPAGLLLLLSTFLVRESWFRETFRYTLQGLALTPLFVVAMREPRWWPFRWLNLRLVRHVGVLSYSLYLTHHVVIYFLEQHLPSLGKVPRGALALLLSLALAQGIHRFIEKPCARLRRRLAHAAWLKGGAAGAPVR